MMRTLIRAPLILAFGLSACATDYARAPLSERAYAAAAKACGTRRVLPLVRGKMNLVGVSGLTHPNPEVSQIDCVRRFLGIAPNDVLVLYGYDGLFHVQDH